MTNKWKSILYIWVTNDLERRVLEHKRGDGSKFTSIYNLYRLPYFQESGSILEAIVREKQLKGRKRKWKIDLIKSMNENFVDLSDRWYEEKLFKR